MRPPRGVRPRRALIALLATGLIAIASAPLANADGDPASDALLVQNVFLPYQQPSAQANSALGQAVGQVYAHGNRVKVALVFDVQDLGAIPSLFGQPTNYAQFLGIELGLWYQGPLLVVMPAGFGFYDGGRATAAAEKILQAITVTGTTPDDLAAAATTALDRLESAGALESPDLLAPLVTAYPADAKRGKPASLRFDVYDDSGSSRALVRVYEADSLLATLTTSMVTQIGTRTVKVRWSVPRKLRSRDLRFCVIATDPSGNRSKPACAPFLRVQ